MQSPTERHLLRRQKYFTFLLQDIIYHAYQRAAQIEKVRRLSEDDYGVLFRTSLPDVSRSDNEALARAAKDISGAIQALGTGSNTLTRENIRMVFKFAGELYLKQCLTR